MKVYIKNYQKNNKKTQVLIIENNGEYQHYFVNYSKNKQSVYLTPSKDVK